MPHKLLFYGSQSCLNIYSLNSYWPLMIDAYCRRVSGARMIDEPRFPSIHSVYEYLGIGNPIDSFSGDSLGQWLSASQIKSESLEYGLSHEIPVQVYDDEDHAYHSYLLRMSLFDHVLTGTGSDSGSKSIESVARFHEKRCRKEGALSLWIDDEAFLFQSESDRDEVAAYIDARNSLARAAARDGVNEAFGIAERLYCDGYSQVMANFEKAIPEVVYANQVAAAALLFYIGVGDKVLDHYSRIDSRLKDVCRNFILDGNKGAYDQLKQLFINLAEVLENEEGVNPALSMTVGYLLYRKRLIEDYITAWNNAYGTLPGDDLESYVTECVNSNRLTEGDAASISALSYCAMGVIPLYSKDDFIRVYSDVEQLVNIAERRKSKSHFKEMLFSDSSAAGARSRITIDDVDLMTGDEFEHFIAKLFKAMGYEVSITQRTADQGIDVIARNDAMTLGIQAKCYSQAVGNSAVQEAVAGKAYYSCNKVMVITNSSFTSSAKQLAAANGVLLWDRGMVMKKLSEHPVVQ